jgi:SAM-dependent methyltransferase
MADQEHTVSEERLYFFDTEEVRLEKLGGTGLVLDIGGGGEGVIGRLAGTRVVAIDPNRRELEEAPEGPLRIVMDGADLQFLDHEFSLATSFYTLMYISSGEVLRKVLAEIHRVLAPGGRLLVWDAVVPPRGDESRDIAVISLDVKLPDEQLEAKYGMRWPQSGRGAEYYVEPATETGFEVATRNQEGMRLFLELNKSG